MRQICKLEGVKIDDPVLKELVNQSNNDVRSTINSLQFLVSLKSQNPADRISIDDFK